MKKIIHNTMLIVLGWSIGSCQALSLQELREAGHQATSTGEKESYLSASAEIVKQSYCHQDWDSFSVRMEVKVRLTNVSSEPVILSRKINSPGIIHVARSVEDVKSGNFEYAPNIDLFTQEPPSVPQFGDIPDPQRFIVLKTGESYEVVVPSGVFGTMKQSSGHGLLARGIHLLQLGISTWPYPNTPEAVRKLQAAWSGVGHLASGVVYSDLISFAIPEKFKNPLCGG